MNTPITTPTLRLDHAVDLPASPSFVVRDQVALGRSYGSYTVTYVGPNFLRLFGESHVAERPERRGRVLVLDEWSADEAVSPTVGDGASLADLFALLELGPEGPGRFDGESNTVYATADGARWTPHFYTRGHRLGFGALPFGDKVGWEPGDVFLAGAPS